MTDNEQREKWQHDEQRWRWVFGIGVTLLLATGGHLVTGVWWASSITERMGVIEQRHQRLSDRTDARSAQHERGMTLMQSEIQADRVVNARQEQKLETVIKLLEEMRAEIQRSMQRAQ